MLLESSIASIVFQDSQLAGLAGFTSTLSHFTRRATTAEKQSDSQPKLYWGSNPFNSKGLCFTQDFSKASAL
jgi:hypothetical protein